MPVLPVVHAVAHASSEALRTKSTAEFSHTLRHNLDVGYRTQDLESQIRRMAQNLRHHGRRKRKRGNEYKSRGQIVDRVDISLRPPEVDEKLRLEDFEIDTIIGKNCKVVVMTINDRCAKIVFIRRLTGKEFARHKEIAKGLDLQFFFARSYHSWERGANENTNGLARQYIPMSLI